jgi:tRNA G10  N-methylase Trm11
MQILVLGREKNLCRAEIESVFGDYKQISDEVALIDDDKSIDISSLGGTIKVAKVINQNSKTMESDIIDYIIGQPKKGKINFGISFYGTDKTYSGSGIKIKKQLKSKGLSVRYIQPQKSNQLNAASVIYNKLTINGFEIIVVRKKDGSVLLAQTTAVQNINEYSKRDYDKPCRDRKVGMLPPKLSQIMINLAGVDKKTLIVDPFCGSAGLLMEASLMGYATEGSDLSGDMVACSNKNIEWFSNNYKPLIVPKISEALDATTRKYPTQDYAIVTEGFLGINFIFKPSAKTIEEQMPYLKSLYINFLNNLSKQQCKPSAIVLCMPFWSLEGSSYSLNILDEILNLGYTIHEFQSVRSSDLRYQREGQFTGRQIVVLN